MSLIERIRIVQAAAPANYNGTAVTPTYVSLKNYGHLTIVIATGAWEDGAAAVTLEEAKDVSGTGAREFSFSEYWHGAAGGALTRAQCSDTFDVDAENHIYVIEVDANSLDIAGGYDCIGVAIASPGEYDDFYGAAYVLSESRYAGVPLPSPLVD